MRQLQKFPISAQDLLEFLNEGHSDFAFEIQALNILINHGFTCEHGGTYDDPVTRQPREFDIRATKRFDRRFLRLAVECKNVRENFPLLISCMPRTQQEAFHEILFSFNPQTIPVGRNNIRASLLAQSKNIPIGGDDTFYPKGEFVGKSCEQVGREQGRNQKKNPNKGEITSSDSGVYSKWSQALSSAHELTYLSCTDGRQNTGDVALSLVFPMVVVPNGRLWGVNFDSDGNRITDPTPIKRCSYFVNQKYCHRSVAGGDSLTITHLEFVTIDGLKEFINSFCQSEPHLDKTYPKEFLNPRLEYASATWQSLDLK